MIVDDEDTVQRTNLLLGGYANSEGFAQDVRECRPREPEEPVSTGVRALRVGSSALVDRLLNLSKCPDFVVNRGHIFGSTLSDVDKRALIEFLKTF
jgi:hypothetical protein